MKRPNWKTVLLIILALAMVLALSGCAAYYKPQDSNWIIQVW